jgi:selenophosphate synthetase-related protein
MILKIRVKIRGVMKEDRVVTSFSVLNGDLLMFAIEKDL